MLEDDSTGWPCSQPFLFFEIRHQPAMVSIHPIVIRLGAVIVKHSQRPNAERVFFDERRKKPGVSCAWFCGGRMHVITCEAKYREALVKSPHAFRASQNRS